MHTPVRKITALKGRVKARRERRRRQLRAERELAHYSTAADRLEIDAIIARHTPEQTRHIEQILIRQRPL